MLSIAHSGGHKAVIHTAAASALGRMLVRAGRTDGIRVLNIVRRPEQKKVRL